MGQNCSFSISGTVADAHTGKGLEEATVFSKELQTKIITSKNGSFQFTKICASDYHFEVNYLGYSPVSVYLDVKKDTVLIFELHPLSELIDEVELQGEKEISLIQTSSTIGENEVAELGSKGLSKAIEGMSGVSTLSNGGGISKPVIHGMWGNRVSIINNGIAQSGQQWGTDHAPEIDPFTAHHISVLKGASALAYGGVSLGGVVLVEQSKISNDPHLHGKVNYVFQSNGLGNTVNLNLEKRTRLGGFRLSGTLKLIGDSKSPNYFLTNTGNREADIALTYQNRIGAIYTHEVYYSLFTTQIGILRGSHISNSTDLEQAFTRDEPFFTHDYFSYNIEAPRQLVQHHLLKYKGDLTLKNSHQMHFKYGGQLNNRKEFDVRRNGRSDSPALSILQNTQLLELKHLWLPSNIWRLEEGLQYAYIDNTNDNSSTGRMPLIPDYRSNKISAFGISKHYLGRWSFEVGGRVDFRMLEVLAISDTFPRTINREDHQFLNFNISAGAKYRLSRNLSLKLDLGYVQRQPEVNELYSSGLHQGLASVEYGNPNLVAENSFKALTELEGNFLENGIFQVVGYYQNINDYIFLKPTGEYEINISGSFPIFIYAQTNAVIYGSDLTLAYKFSKKLRASIQVSLLKGNDTKDSVPLIFMPANNGLAKVNYTFKDQNNWRNTTVGLTGKYVAQQKHLNANQDFVPPPEAYFLLGFDATTSFKKMQFSVRVDNLLNTVYRDYLNRQRYFADDLGINIQLRVGFKF